MNKLIAVLICAVLFAYVLARPANEQIAGAVSTTVATIIKQDIINNEDGSFNNSFETSNGIRVQNIGYLKRIIVPRVETSDGNVIEEHEELVLVQSGSYSYSDPDGNIITLRYVADENGFQPQGDHLPLAPQ